MVQHPGRYERTARSLPPSRHPSAGGAGGYAAHLLRGSLCPGDEHHRPVYRHPGRNPEFLPHFSTLSLIRAYNLERALDTPAKIYYKFEGNNTSGSHKLNSAAAQVYYAKNKGLTCLTTETGAGQWGTALSMACAHYGLDLTVYMVKVSYEQKPFRKAVIQTFGANIVPSPSGHHRNRARHSESPIRAPAARWAAPFSEAIEKALHTPGCRYVLGSVLNQVLLHQSIIGLESKAAMEKIGEYPDIVIGCAGGGSNLGGLMAAFMQDTLTGVRTGTEFIAVEPASCPSLTRGAGMPMISATPAMSPPSPGCTRSAASSSPPPTTRADCVITA